MSTAEPEPKPRFLLGGDAKVWAGAIIFTLAAVVQFIEKPGWPTALLIMATTLSTLILALWIMFFVRQQEVRNHDCTKELRVTRRAVERLTWIVATSSGGRRKSAAAQDLVDKIFSDDWEGPEAAG